MIILWIDPWTTTVWYALVEMEGNAKTLLDYWIIETTPKIPLKNKLLEIANDLNEILDNYNVDKAVIERLFFTKNVTTGIEVAHSRWVIMYLLAKNNILIEEYTPLQLKKAICWNWKANKAQLQNAIKIFFELDEIPKPDDAADAIGLAFMWWLFSNKLM